MNIYLINQYAGSPQFGMEYRPYHLSKIWTEMGHNVTIFASSYSHLRVAQPQMKQNKFIKKELIDGINYVWIRGNRYSGNGLFRFLNIITFIGILSFLIRRFTQSPDIIIASSTHPLDYYPVMALLKKNPKCKYVYEPHDLWPMVLYEIGGMSRRHPFVMLLQHAEDMSCKNSDVVISMHPQNIIHLESRGCQPEKFWHIPNGIDIDSYKIQTPLPDLHKNLLVELKARGEMIVLYSGSISIANGLDILVQVAKDIEDRKVSLVLVGDGPERKTLEAEISKKSLNNITILPKIMKSSIPQLISLADICYVGFVHNPLYKFGISPNKLWDYMMGSKPILLSINASNDPVSDAKCGISVKTGEKADIIDAIDLFLEMDLESRVKMGRNGKNYVLENNDYRILAKRFLHCITSTDKE